MLAKVVATLLLPLYTNALSQAEYGAMALIMALKGIIDLFSNLNIHSGVAREYNEEGIDRDKLVSTGFYSILFLSMLTLGLFYLSRDFWIEKVLGVHGYGAAFNIMLLTLPAGSLFSYFGILTRIQQKALMFSIGHLIQLIFQISTTIYFVLFAKIGIIGVFYGVLIGECIGILFLMILNRKHLKKTFSTDLLKTIFVYSLPTLPAIVAGWMDRSLGQVLIGKYISIEDAGIYSVALRITSVLMLFHITLSNVWHPYVYENYLKPGFWKDVKRIYTVSFLVLIALSLNLSMLSDWVIIVLSNKSYLPASNYVSLLLISTSLAIMGSFVDIGPRLTRKTRYISQSTIIGSIVNIGLLFLFVRRFGVVSVPISLALSGLISYTLRSYYTKQQVSFSFPHKYILILIFGVLLTILFKSLVEGFVLTMIILVILDSILFLYIYKRFRLMELIRKLREQRN